MGFLSELRSRAISANPATQENGAAASGEPGSGTSRNSRVLLSQTRVREACTKIGLSFDDISRRIDFGSVADCDDRLLGAYLLALAMRVEREACTIPAAYTIPAHCEGCGPVWLWPGAERVQACPWCWNRRAGRSIPRPRVPLA